MTEGPLRVTPPDDTGSDTFRRFRYQAEVAFPFCLDTALIGNVISVIPEHLEDLAIEFADGSWRIIQIKTRDPGQAPWTLATLLGGDGGAFRSLLRTHRALANVTEQVAYELRLEGSLRRGDDALRLAAGGDGPTTGMVEMVADRLGVDAAEAAVLLGRLTIRDGEPSRDAIDAVNLRKLGLAAPEASVSTVREVYRSVVERIEAAMDRRLGDDQWPAAVVDQSLRTESDRETMRDKRLTRDILDPLFSPLGSPEPTLLAHIADPDAHTSALEDKLAAWGASRPVIEDAKLLRAHASIRETEIEASSLFGAAGTLEDLRIRLRVVANAAAAEVGGTGTADRVWAVLQGRLHDQRDTLDQHGLLKRDPMLLLGEVCQLSDLCEYGWGRPSA